MYALFTRLQNLKALDTLKKIKNVGGSGKIMQFDVTDHNEVQEKLNAWQENNKDSIIEVIVNNAGITKDKLFTWMKQDDWNDVINISLNGFFNVTNHLIKNMLSQKYGRIINIVSVSGLQGNIGQTNYSAAKGALIAATKSLAKETALVTDDPLPVNITLATVLSTDNVVTSTSLPKLTVPPILLRVKVLTPLIVLLSVRVTSALAILFSVVKVKALLPPVTVPMVMSALLVVVELVSMVTLLPSVTAPNVIASSELAMVPLTVIVPPTLVVVSPPL